MRVGERLAWQGLDQRSGWRNRRGYLRRGAMIVIVVIIFEIFEDVAHVEEGVAIQADINERRLHARKHASHSAFVDAADQRELFFALDINFD